MNDNCYGASLPRPIQGSRVGRLAGFPTRSSIFVAVSSVLCNTRLDCQRLLGFIYFLFRVSNRAIDTYFREVYDLPLCLCRLCTRSGEDWGRGRFRVTQHEIICVVTRGQLQYLGLAQVVYSLLTPATDDIKALFLPEWPIYHFLVLHL